MLHDIFQEAQAHGARSATNSIFIQDFFYGRKFLDDLFDADGSNRLSIVNLV